MIGNKIRNLFQKNIVKNVFKIASGNIIAQILSFIFTPILSRLYGPVYYGDLGILISISNIIMTGASLGLVSAIMSPKDNETASALYKICNLSCFMIFILFLVFAFLSYPYVTIMNTSGDYYFSVFLMLLMMFSGSYMSVQSIWANRVEAYKLLLINPILFIIVKFIVAILTYKLGYKEYGLIFSVILGQFVVILHLFIALRDKPYYYKTQFKDLFNIYKQYISFTKYQMTSNLIKVVSNSLPVLMFGSVFGSAFVGEYNMGTTLLQLPITLIAGAVGQVHFREATKLYNNGESPALLTFKVAKNIMLASFIPLLLISIFGKQIFSLFLGKEWIEAGNIVEIRGLEFVFTCAFYSISYIYVIIKKQNIVLIHSIATVIVNVILLTVGAYIIKDKMITVIILTVSNVLLNIAFIAIAFYIMKRHLYVFLRLSVLLIVLFLALFVGFHFIVK